MSGPIFRRTPINAVSRGAKSRDQSIGACYPEPQVQSHQRVHVSARLGRHPHISEMLQHAALADLVFRTGPPGSRGLKVAKSHIDCLSIHKRMWMTSLSIHESNGVLA